METPLCVWCRSEVSIAIRLTLAAQSNLKIHAIQVEEFRRLNSEMWSSSGKYFWAIMRANALPVFPSAIVLHLFKQFASKRRWYDMGIWNVLWLIITSRQCFATGESFLMGLFLISTQSRLKHVDLKTWLEKVSSRSLKSAIVATLFWLPFPHKFRQTFQSSQTFLSLILLHHPSLVDLIKFWEFTIVTLLKSELNSQAFAF